VVLSAAAQCAKDIDVIFQGSLCCFMQHNRQAQAPAADTTKQLLVKIMNKQEIK
jgi:hypothetical protein